MAMTLDDFHGDFFQEVVLRSDASGDLKENVFYEQFCSFLVDAGELETADRAAFVSPRGLRVDGYGGDPAESDGILNIITMDFSQGPAVAGLTASDMSASLKRATKFIVSALDVRFRNGLEETSDAFGLADLIATRWSAVRKVRVVLITNKLLSERVGGKDSERIDGRGLVYDVWDIGRLHRYVSSGLAREDIDIDLVNEFGGPISSLSAHLEGSDYEAYVAVVPGAQLAAIYERWGPRLLEQNVRVFLQARSKVNKGIKNTLDVEPEMFFAYNNGITATATSVETGATETGVAITRLRNLQIVNGGQTTASIHEASRRPGCDMAKVFVQMKLSIIEPARAVEIVPRISEYANSQNKINAADFFANHPFHVRMEDFSRRVHAPAEEGVFRQSKWFYERARGQYQDARASLSTAQRKKFDLEYPKAQMFSKTDLAKYLLVWDELPHVVSMGAQKNLAEFVHAVGTKWKGDAPEFNERYFHHAVAKIIVFRRTERLVSNEDWYTGGYRANIVAYALSKLASDARAKGLVVDFDGIWKKQGVSPAMERAITLAAKHARASITDTPGNISNVTEWAKRRGCWDRFSEVEVNWPQSWLNELLTPGQERSERKLARREQKDWSEIEAQTAVCIQGNEFWKKVKAWGNERRLLTPDEVSVLSYAEAMPARVPSGKQSIWIIRIFGRLQDEGCQMVLES